MASRETIPVLNEALVDLTLEWNTLKLWVFITKVMDMFILELDVLQAYDALVDLGCHVL
jgi:hypothetical protein